MSTPTALLLLHVLLQLRLHGLQLHALLLLKGSRSHLQLLLLPWGVFAAAASSRTGDAMPLQRRALHQPGDQHVPHRGSAPPLPSCHAVRLALGRREERGTRSEGRGEGREEAMAVTHLSCHAARSGVSAVARGEERRGKGMRREEHGRRKGEGREDVIADRQSMQQTWTTA